MSPRGRLGIVMSADRLTVAVARGGKVVATFVVAAAENAPAALRSELAARKLRARRARLGLVRNLVTVKPLDLPPTSESDVRQMVQFEVERHVPYGAEETAFDFTPLSVHDGRRRMLVVAAERRLVDRALRMATDSHLRPVSLTVASHDLVALLSPRAPRRAIWLHRTAETIDMLFLSGRALLLSRSLALADDETLAAEIRASLSMLRWDACDALWISGDEADGLLVSPAMRALGVTLGPPALSAAARRMFSTTSSPLDGAAWLATAVALGRGKRRLNLLPPALRPRRPRAAQLVTVALAVLAAALGATTLLMQAHRDEERLARLDAEIRRLDPQVTAIERLRTDLERRRKLLNTLQTAQTSGLQPLPVLKELTETLPSDAWLTALSLDQNGVELTGQAAAASALIPLLENSPTLERVEFVSPVTRGRDKELFRIKATWERATPATSTPSARSAPSPGDRAAQPSSSAITGAAAPPPAPAPPVSPPNTGALAPGASGARATRPALVPGGPVRGPGQPPAGEDDN